MSKIISFLNIRSSIEGRVAPAPLLNSLILGICLDLVVVDSGDREVRLLASRRGGIDVHAEDALGASVLREEVVVAVVILEESPENHGVHAAAHRDGVAIQQLRADVGEVPLEAVLLHHDRLDFQIRFLPNLLHRDGFRAHDDAFRHHHVGDDEDAFQILILDRGPVDGMEHPVVAEIAFLGLLRDENVLVERPPVGGRTDDPIPEEEDFGDRGVVRADLRFPQTLRFRRSRLVAHHENEVADPVPVLRGEVVGGELVDCRLRVAEVLDDLERRPRPDELHIAPVHDLVELANRVLGFRGVRF